MKKLWEIKTSGATVDVAWQRPTRRPPEVMPHSTIAIKTTSTSASAAAVSWKTWTTD